MSAESQSSRGSSVTKRVAWKSGGSSKELFYEVEANWILLHKNDEPSAEMFFTSYVAQEVEFDRPVTFVFNGGPGASSAYLHIGALGPKRVHFEADGSLPAPPARLTDNEESWLAFTDLVFVDPIGTGFSRVLASKKGASGNAVGKSVSPDSSTNPATNSASTSNGSEKQNSIEPGDSKEYYQVNRDLDSLSEFIKRWLSTRRRWSSPVYIAGESYGGFRVAKLAKRLQETHGVGLSGAIMISPAIEFGLLFGNDYDANMWADLFPSLVASAWFHRKGQFAQTQGELHDALRTAEKFFVEDLSRLLIGSPFLAKTDRDRILLRQSELTGLDARYLSDKEGRVSATDFSRRLLKEDRRTCGLYDSSVTLLDPFPDRDTLQGPEPTLFATARVFTGGINILFREWLSLQSERDYQLLNMDVNNSWKVDDRQHDTFQPHQSSMDDLRYGMCLNPHMKVMISHGYFDLITPYFSSRRLVGMMRLTDEQIKQLLITNYKGGHMFYTWEQSRKAFVRDVSALYGVNAK